tara:strand:+ start:1026 stop:2093 length:1068 start_codon:yes stop_codon:yes gene_type:complete
MSQEVSNTIESQSGSKTETPSKIETPTTIKSKVEKIGFFSQFEEYVKSIGELDITKFLKEYMFEILLGIIVLGVIVFKLSGNMLNSLTLVKEKLDFKFNIKQTNIDPNIELPLIVYINLEEDTDKNNKMIKLFEKLNYPRDKIIRFNAIKKNPGLEGCRLSHIEANKLAIQNMGDCPYYMICEDDIELIGDFYGTIYRCLELQNENVDMIKLEGMVTDDVINIENRTLMVPTNNTNFMRGLYTHPFTGSGQAAGCYLSTINFGKKVIEILEKNIYKHADHTVGLLFNTNKVYISRPMLFRQSIHYSHIEHRDRVYYPVFNFELWDHYYEKYHKYLIKNNFIVKGDKFYLKLKLSP